MKWRALPIILAICSYATLAHSAFTLVPGVDFSMYYDDNIFLDSNNEKDDVITTVAPSFTLNWDTSRLEVDAYASIAFVKYLDYTDEDRIGAGESTQASSLSALAKLYPDLLYLRVSDTYSRIPIDEGGSGGENNTTVNLTDSNTLEINPYVKFPVMKNTDLEMGYTYENLWYKDDDSDSSESHIYSGTLTSEFSAKTSGTLSGSFRQYRPDNTEDVFIPGEAGVYEYDRRDAIVGLSYQATDRLNFKGEYGHTWLNYDALDDSDSPRWLAGVEYEFFKAFTIESTYSQDYVNSVDDGPSDDETVSVNLKYDDRFKVIFSLYSTRNDFVEIERKDDTYGGEVSGELPFNDKIGSEGLLRYENFDRKGLDAEEFDRYSAKIALYYDTRLGRITSGYVYNRNDSDMDDEDYTDNIVFIGGSLIF